MSHRIILRPPKPNSAYRFHSCWQLLLQRRGAPTATARVQKINFSKILFMALSDHIFLTINWNGLNFW